MDTWQRYLLIALGGAAGSCARHAVGTFVAARAGASFPWGTVVANVSGCFLIGAVLTALLARPDPDERWRLLLVVGFCGGYTTFSTFAWETDRLLDGRSFGPAVANVVGSVVAGLAALRVGAFVASRVW